MSPYGTTEKEQRKITSNQSCNLKSQEHDDTDK
jgi:hypothetical protein